MTATTATNARTKAEREQMLASVQNAIRSEVRRAKIPEQHREDVEQNAQLAVWQVTEKFDPNRGVKFSTFAISIIRNTVANWRAHHNHEHVGTIVTKDHEYFERLSWPQCIEPLSSDDDDELSADETTGQLATSVRRTLAEGVLAQLGDGHRRLVEMVVYDGLSPDQIATQLGFPPKVVRLNLKTALRTLCRKGFTSHAATDQEIADATAPQNVYTVEEHERQKEMNRNRSRLAANAQVVNQLDAAAREDAFTLELARLDDDTRVVVQALIERSFTVDEAIELLGGKRATVLKRLRNVAEMGREGANAAVADTGELIAR